VILLVINSGTIDFDSADFVILVESVVLTISQPPTTHYNQNSRTLLTQNTTLKESTQLFKFTYTAQNISFIKHFITPLTLHKEKRKTIFLHVCCKDQPQIVFFLNSVNLTEQNRGEKVQKRRDEERRWSRHGEIKKARLRLKKARPVAEVDWMPRSD